MKRLFVLALVFVGLAAECQIVQQSGDIKIVNSDNQVKISAYDSTQTLPWLEFGSYTNVAFSLPASGIIPTTYGGTGNSSNYVSGVTGYSLKTNTIVYVSALTLSKTTNAFVSALSFTTNASGVVTNISPTYTTNVYVTNTTATLSTNTINYLGQ